MGPLNILQVLSFQFLHKFRINPIRDPVVLEDLLYLLQVVLADQLQDGLVDHWGDEGLGVGKGMGLLYLHGDGFGLVGFVVGLVVLVGILGWAFYISIVSKFYCIFYMYSLIFYMAMIFTIYFSFMLDYRSKSITKGIIF